MIRPNMGERDGEPRGPEREIDLKSGRFRTDAELTEAGRKLRFERAVNRDFRPSRRALVACALAVGLPIFAVLIWLGGWGRGSVMIVQSLTIPVGFLLLSLGFAGRADVGIPLCGKCRHALPPDATPDRCGECGTWLRSGVQVVRDGRPARKPGLIVAGATMLSLYFGSLAWNMLGLSSALPNVTLISWAATGTGDRETWAEITRRAGSGRLSATELDELASVAIAAIARDLSPSVNCRTFLEVEWLAGRLSPQRQRECLRLAYRLALERRGDRAVLVASMRLSPQPSPAHFPRLAIDRLVIDGRPGPPIQRVFEHDAIPYEQSSDKPLEINLGEVQASAKTIAIEGFVLSSPFARGRAEWEADSDLLNLDPGTLAAPFVIDGPP